MQRREGAGAVVSLTKDLLGLMASSGLLILAQRPFEWGFLATIALVPWLARTRRASASGAFAKGLLFGVLFSLGAASWIFDALAAQGSTGARRVLAAILIAAWAKGLLFAVVAWVVHGLKSRSPAIAVLVPAMLFGFGEYWISHSSWGLPLLLLGHSQISVPGVAQLAVIVGVPGISAMLFALNLSILSAILDEHGGRRMALAIGSIWLLAMVAGMPVARMSSPAPRGEPRRLLVVQPPTAGQDRWTSADQSALLEEIVAQTDHALDEAERPPDAILWPESILTLPVEPGDRFGRLIQRKIDVWDVPVVLGLVREPRETGETNGAQGPRAVSGGRYVNSVLWWSPILGPVDSQDKVRAIPVVETSRRFPGQLMLDWAIARGAGGPRVVEGLRAGPLKGAFTLTPALCFEILFPRVVADRRDDESVAIVNLTDDSWVGGETLDAQLLAAAAFRAIEERLTMVRVSHGGLSAAIDRFGREFASLPPNRAGHMTIEVAANPRPSWVERAAALIPPVVVGFAHLLFWRWRDG